MARLSRDSRLATPGRTRDANNTCYSVTTDRDQVELVSDPEHSCDHRTYNKLSILIPDSSSNIHDITPQVTQFDREVERRTESRIA